MEQSDSRSGIGMILGKFMPPHAGHTYLVNFGLQFVEHLYVLVCTRPQEPIPGALRFRWMCELFPHVRVVHVTEDLPQEPQDHPHFWDLWRGAIERAVQHNIDFVFASEEYGHRLAAELGATFIPVDLSRATVPVSGTAIRSRPLQHWEFLPDCVRPYYVKRVCLFGPESTGKSTLARDLAAYNRTVYVPEFARGWLEPRQGKCELADIPIIARGQTASENALARRANRILFCDTDLLLTTVWSDVLFGECPHWIREAATRNHYDLYLLLDVDVPWVDDLQRYLPHARESFFHRCRAVLEQHHRPFIVIAGDWEARWQQACCAVDQLLNQPAQERRGYGN